MNNEIDHFIDELAFARGLSLHTQEAYGRDLRDFDSYLKRNGKASLSAATRLDIVNFMANERKAGYAETTISRRLAALKAFYDWLSDGTPADTNPTDTLMPPKKEKLLPDTLTEEDVSKLVSSYSGTEPLDIRNRAMLELLYASGLRATELVSLAQNDLYLDEAFLRCRGKGNKERIVPIGSKAIKALCDYIINARPLLIKEENHSILFVSRSGAKLDRSTLWRVVDSAARKSGVYNNVHPHTLRHCFATHLLSHGANIRAIQEMLGHADIATTQIYTHVDTEKILSVHKRFHPRG